MHMEMGHVLMTARVKWEVCSKITFLILVGPCFVLSKRSQWVDVTPYLSWQAAPPELI